MVAAAREHKNDDVEKRMWNFDLSVVRRKIQLGVGSKLGLF